MRRTSDSTHAANSGLARSVARSLFAVVHVCPEALLEREKASSGER